MYEEDSNLEAMLNNPFQNLSAGKAPLRNSPAHTEKAGSSAGTGGERLPEGVNDGSVSRTERNHPLELRVLGLEKDLLLAAKRMDDLKRIIDHQNERIQLLEEELDILRKGLGKEGK